ncbi:MAG: hypothetical protein LBG97_01165 [Coriobacteriales bacterium]|jgi:hypothetical protein|nr:hypothetical protein [Coriobacteriales bacterium]
MISSVAALHEESFGRSDDIFASQNAKELSATELAKHAKQINRAEQKAQIELAGSAKQSEPAEQAEYTKRIKPAKPLNTTDIKRNLPQILFLVLALLASLLICSISLFNAAASAESLSGLNQTATFRISGTPLTAENATKLATDAAKYKDLPSFIIWGETKLASVNNSMLARSTEVSLIHTQGNISLLLPETVTGILETEKCVISTKAAEQVFGDSSAIGLTLEYEDVKLKVADVVKGDRAFVILNASKQDSAAFDTITILREPHTSSAALQERFAAVLGQNLLLIDYPLLHQISVAFCWLVPLFFSLALIIFMLFLALRKNNDYRIQILWFSATVFVLVAIVAFLYFNINLPKEMLPSKWSDFSQLQQIVGTKLDALRYLFDAAVPTVYGKYYDAYFKAVSLSLLSLTLAIVFVICLNRLLILFATDKPKHLLQESATASTQSATMSSTHAHAATPAQAPTTALMHIHTTAPTLACVPTANANGMSSTRNLRQNLRQEISTNDIRTKHTSGLRGLNGFADARQGSST